ASKLRRPCRLNPLALTQGVEAISVAHLRALPRVVGKLHRGEFHAFETAHGRDAHASSENVERPVTIHVGESEAHAEEISIVETSGVVAKNSFTIVVIEVHTAVVIQCDQIEIAVVIEVHE